MVTWERFMDILALHRQGLSLREISDKLGIHRKTVTKYVNQGHPPKYRKVKRNESILTPYLDLIDQWLEQDNFRASWIFHQIKNLGYGGGYDTVKNHVRKVKARYQHKAYLRFETVPGLQGQMAFPGPCMPSFCPNVPLSFLWMPIYVRFGIWVASRWRSSTTT